MKYTLIATILFLNIQYLTAQSTYHDALELRKFIERSPVTQNYLFKIPGDAQKDSVFGILKKYTEHKNSNETNYKTIADSFYDAENTYITTFFAGRPSSGSLNISNIAEGFLSQAGSLNVTNLADGLAKFLVQRTKEELSIAFFEKFKTELDEQKELRILFPATYRSLTVIGESIYQFSGYIEMLRQAFQKDFAALLPNLQTLIDDNTMDPVFDKFPQLRIILSDGLDISIRLKNGDHIGDALNSYITSRANDLNKVDTTLYSSVVLLNIFSQSLRSRNHEQYWITLTQIRELQDEVLLKLYLGLVYQQIVLYEKQYLTDNGKTHFLKLNGIAVTQILRNGAENFEAFKKSVLEEYLYPLIEKGQLVDEKFKSIKAYQTDAEKEPTYQDYYELLNATLDFVEQIKNTHAKFAGNSDTGNNDVVEKYLNTLRSMGNIYMDLNQKQYVAAVSELAFLYDEVIVKRLAKRKEYFENLEQLTEDKKKNNTEIIASVNVLNNQYSSYFNEKERLKVDSRETIQKEIKDRKGTILAGEDSLLSTNKRITRFLIKYGNFAALVAKAETSEQVKEIIESAALPAGSSRIKRESIANISLNAYMGLYAGRENIEVNDNDNYASTFGLSAPVGVAFSLGFPRKKNAGGKSFSLLLSLIDIGALASFRFNDDHTESVPEIQLKDIISPGAFIVFGPGKVPLSFGAGYQIGPRLHEVTATENTGVSDIYNRFSVFIAVDIPIINFYTKPK